MHSAASLALVLGAASLAAAGPAKVEARATSSATSSGSLPTVTTNGNAFFAGSDRFYIRGVRCAQTHEIRNTC